MNTSIIIVNYNGLRYTQQCLESLFLFHAPDTIEVIVVDNNSSDGSQKELPRLFPAIDLIPLPENRGFGAANNIGAKKAKGEYLFFVNNDTIFKEETVDALRRMFFIQSEFGIVGPKLLNEDGTFQRSFGDFPSIRNELAEKRMARNYSAQETTSEQPLRKDWVTGAAFMVKRGLFETVRGFDDVFFMYFEDIDLCRTLAERGIWSLYVPTVTMIHLGGKSYGAKDRRIALEYRRSQLRYYDKHNSRVQRFMVRSYIIIKYFPRIFEQGGINQVKDLVKMVFSSQQKKY